MWEPLRWPVYSKYENEVETALAHTKLYFLDDNLVKIVDLITGQCMKLTYDSTDRVTTVGIYSSDNEEAEKLYVNNYAYDIEETRVTTEGESRLTIYYFDSLGRVRTQIDTSGGCVSYEYVDNLENGNFYGYYAGYYYLYDSSLNIIDEINERLNWILEIN